MAEEPKPEDQDNLRSSKIALDYFKHMTTISAAAALALVAIYREALLNKELPFLALAAVGVSAVASFFGIGQTLLNSLEIANDRHVSNQMIRRCGQISAASLAAALGAVLWESSGWPDWPAISVAIVALVFYSGRWVYRRFLQ